MSRLFNKSNSDRILVDGSGGGGPVNGMAAWIYLTSQPSNGGAPYTIASNARFGWFGYGFYYYQTGGTKYLEYNTYPSFGTDRIVNAAVTLSSSTWHHVAFAVPAGSSNHAIYVNGVSQTLGRNDFLATNVSSGGQGMIGALNWSSVTWFFDGRIAELALFSRFSDPPQAWEAAALYKGTFPMELRPDNQYTGEPHRWDFFSFHPLEGWSDPEPDWSSNRYHSTSIVGTSRADGPPTDLWPRPGRE